MAKHDVPDGPMGNVSLKKAYIVQDRRKKE
jgi:hypothetical protein